MLRIGSLLRNRQLLKKNIFRAGMPGWDRPDPPPTEKVPRETIYSSQELIYTFFDSSMPEYVLTQPQIYQGTLIEALPSLGKMWGFVLGSAFTVYLFFRLNNPFRNQRIYEPKYAEFVKSQQNKIVDEKMELKSMRENPFGFKINAQQYPAWNSGKLVHTPLYQDIQRGVKLYTQINKQARNYINGIQQRSKHKKEETHGHGHGHH